MKHLWKQETGHEWLGFTQANILLASEKKEKKQTEMQTVVYNKFWMWSCVVYKKNKWQSHLPITHYLLWNLCNSWQMIEIGNDSYENDNVWLWQSWIEIMYQYGKK